MEKPKKPEQNNDFIIIHYYFSTYGRMEMFFLAFYKKISRPIYEHMYTQCCMQKEKYFRYNDKIVRLFDHQIFLKECNQNIQEPYIEKKKKYRKIQIL